MKRKTKAPNTKPATKQVDLPSAEWFVNELDRLMDQPKHVRESQAWQDRYLDTILLFYAIRPDEATPFLKAVLPKVKTLSNRDVRVLSQMSATAFPAASFPYLTFAKNNRVPVQTVGDWFTETVVPAAGLAWMKRQFQNLVYMGVWSHLKGQEDLCKGADLAEEVENCSQLVWAWAALPENISSLMRERSKNPKRIGTRLKAFATRNVARTWLTLAIRSKKKEPPIIAVGDLDVPIAPSPKTIGGGTPLEHRKPRTKAMYCAPCGSLMAVFSEAEGSLHLACGHLRNVISPGVASSTK